MYTTSLCKLHNTHLFTIHTYPQYTPIHNNDHKFAIMLIAKTFLAAIFHAVLSRVINS